MGHFFTWPPGPSAVRLTTHTGSYVARTVPENKTKTNTKAKAKAKAKAKSPSAHRGSNTLAALVDLRRRVRPLDVCLCPKLDQQSSGVEDLCFSVCPPGEDRDSNRLSALVGLCRPVGVLDLKRYAHQKAERLTALVDLCRSLRPLRVMDSRQIGGVEGLCCTVRFLSVLDEIKDVPDPTETVFFGSCILGKQKPER